MATGLSSSHCVSKRAFLESFREWGSWYSIAFLQGLWHGEGECVHLRGLKSRFHKVSVTNQIPSLPVTPTPKMMGSAFHLPSPIFYPENPQGANRSQTQNPIPSESVTCAWNKKKSKLWGSSKLHACAYPLL